MNNWYKKAQGMHQTHDRFYYTVTFAVWVPQGMDEETGLKVLTARLPRTAGNSEIDTPGINANISVEEVRTL